ncbi:DNA-binding protein [Colwellia sp. TT2012]|uniref:DNA-binding protein n=1 Tax=Colwellia sp. TT2012 TaxID=1720342 RepID=UPI00070B7F0D|nr:DNA-binding protein [Colwellia sp. TT2012]
MKDHQENTTWLTSKEAQKLLKISGCELMHLRVSGKLTFKKQGNAYYYLVQQNQVDQTKPIK